MNRTYWSKRALNRPFSLLIDSIVGKIPLLPRGNPVLVESSGLQAGGCCFFASSMYKRNSCFISNRNSAICRCSKSPVDFSTAVLTSALKDVRASPIKSLTSSAVTPTGLAPLALFTGPTWQKMPFSPLLTRRFRLGTLKKILSWNESTSLKWWVCVKDLLHRD